MSKWVDAEKLSKINAGILDVITGLTFLGCYVVCMIRLHQVYWNDFDEVLDDAKVRYVFGLFSGKLMGLAAGGLFLWFVCVFLLYKLVQFLTVDIAMVRGRRALIRFGFSEAERQLIKKVGNYKLGVQEGCIIGAGLIAIIGLSVIVVSGKELDMQSMVQRSTVLIVVIGVFLTGVSCYLKSRIVAEMRALVGGRFVDKYTLLQLIGAFFVFGLVVFGLKVLVPFLVKMHQGALDYVIRSLRHGISMLKDYFVIVSPEGKYDWVVNRLNTGYVDLIVSLRNKLDWENYGYPLSRLIVLSACSFLVVGIIIPHVSAWGFRKSVVVGAVLGGNYLLSEVMVGTLHLDELFGDRSLAFIAVYVVFLVAIKVVLRQIESRVGG
jgi:hypothetical protein